MWPLRKLRGVQEIAGALGLGAAPSVAALLKRIEEAGRRIPPGELPQIARDSWIKPKQPLQVDPAFGGNFGVTNVQPVTDLGLLGTPQGELFVSAQVGPPDDWDRFEWSLKDPNPGNLLGLNSEEALAKSLTVIAGALERVAATYGAPEPPAPIAQPAPVPAIDSPGVKSRFPLENLGEIRPTNGLAQGFLAGGAQVWGMWMDARRIRTADAQPGFSIGLTVAPDEVAGLEQRLIKAGAERGSSFSFLEAKPGKAPGGGSEAQQSGRSWSPPEAGVLRLESGGAQIELGLGPPSALRGALRIVVTGTDEEATRTLQRLTKTVGLQPLLSAPSAEDRDRYVRARLLAVYDSPRLDELLHRYALSEIPLSELDQRLASVGVGPAELQKVRFEEVSPGYFTVWDPGIEARARKAGARLLYSAVNADSLLSILSGGQKSLLTRLSDGILHEGIGTTDLESGGAHAAFTRLITQSGLDKHTWFTNQLGWNNQGDEVMVQNGITLVYGTELLGRADWWSHPEDEFGSAVGISSQNRGARAVQAIDAADPFMYAVRNEQMFPVGIDPRFIDGIACYNAERRDTVLGKLREAGITEINGRPIEEAVQLASAAGDYKLRA